MRSTQLNQAAMLDCYVDEKALKMMRKSGLCMQSHNFTYQL